MDNATGPRIAAYQWGRFRIVVSPLASFKRANFFSENLAAISSQIIPDQSVEDLIALVSVLHECCHLQQDFIYGVGHNDHIWHCNQMFEVFASAKALSRDRPGSVTSLPIYERRQIENLLENLILAQTSSDELDRVKSFLNTEIGYMSDEFRLFTTRMIMELDAACSVYNTILCARVSRETRENLDKIKGIWEPFSMAEEYSELFKIVFKSLYTHMYKSEGLNIERIRSILFVIRTLCMLSLAVPSTRLSNQLYERCSNESSKDGAETFADGDESFTDRLPGVKFLRYMLAWGRVDIDKDDLVADFAEIVDSKCRGIVEHGYYLSVREIYADWASYFAEVPGYDGIDAARADCCRRLLKPGEMDSLLKTPFGSFVFYNIPLDIRRSDGENHPIYLTPRAWDDDFMVGKRAFDRDAALADFFLGKHPFICPFSGGSCEVSTERCKQGVEDLERLPLVSGCLIRNSLRHQNFAIGAAERIG